MLYKVRQSIHFVNYWLHQILVDSFDWKIFQKIFNCNRHYFDGEHPDKELATDRQLIGVSEIVNER